MSEKKDLNQIINREQHDYNHPTTVTPLDLWHRGTLDGVLKLADVFVKAGYWKDTTDVAKAAVKIILGRELGLTPGQAINNTHIIEGKLVVYSTMLAALIKRSGKYNYKVLEKTNEKCVIEFYENGKPIGVEEYTIDDARRAGLLGRPNWQRYPKAMLFARCLSAGARTYTPDVLAGMPVYTLDEAGDFDRVPTEVHKEAEVLENFEDPKPTANQLQSEESLKHVGKGSIRQAENAFFPRDSKEKSRSQDSPSDEVFADDNRSNNPQPNPPLFGEYDANGQVSEKSSDSSNLDMLVYEDQLFMEAYKFHVEKGKSLAKLLLNKGSAKYLQLMDWQPTEPWHNDAPTTPQMGKVYSIVQKIIGSNNRKEQKAFLSGFIGKRVTTLKAFTKGYISALLMALLEALTFAQGGER